MTCSTCIFNGLESVCRCRTQKDISLQSFLLLCTCNFHSARAVLYKLVILTLIQDVEREPLISTNFSYQGSVYHELRELGILESQFIHPSVSVDRLSPVDGSLSPSNKMRSSLFICWTHRVKNPTLQRLITHLSFPRKIWLCILLRLPKGRHITKQPHTACSSCDPRPGVGKCLL